MKFDSKKQMKMHYMGTLEWARELNTIIAKVPSKD